MSWQAGGKASSASSRAVGDAMDAREFVEEVDLLKRLKATSYQELIGDEKWSEQLKALQLIIEIIGEEYGDIFQFQRFILMIPYFLLLRHY